MSLTVDGFWKAGFWSTTFWADGFWYEGDPVAPPVTTATGGGRSKRKGRRYPRKVQLRGRMYTVRSWDEELSLLQALVDRAEYTAAVEASPVEEKAAVRLKRRLKKVESERDKWLKNLRRADEELLILLM